jgi:hypothetical protein
MRTQCGDREGNLYPAMLVAAIIKLQILLKKFKSTQVRAIRLPFLMENLLRPVA